LPRSEEENKLEEMTKRYYEERFGIPPSEFQGKRFIRRGNEVWAISWEGVEIPDWKRIQALGIRILHIMGHGLKPTSYALQFFGKAIKRSKAEVSIEELRELALGHNLRKDLDCGRGYVAIVHNGDVFGCGFYTGEELRSEIPSARRRELLEAIRQEKEEDGYEGVT